MIKIRLVLGYVIVGVFQLLAANMIKRQLVLVYIAVVVVPTTT